MTHVTVGDGEIIIRPHLMTLKVVLRVKIHKLTDIQFGDLSEIAAYTEPVWFFLNWYKSDQKTRNKIAPSQMA